MTLPLKSALVKRDWQKVVRIGGREENGQCRAEDII
jgi:hypothetical protein